MRPHAAGLFGIRRTYEDPILYTGGTMTAEPLRAIYSEEEAPDFQGQGKTLRTVRFEISRGELPARPRKGDLIEHLGTEWTVDDVTALTEVGAWLVAVFEP